MDFPDSIYSTNDNWGSDTYFCTFREMEKVIESLRELGDDWENVSLSECGDYSLIRVLEDGTALYEGEWHTDGYQRNGRYSAVIFRHDDENGYFERIESYDTISDFEEMNSDV